MEHLTKRGIFLLIVDIILITVAFHLAAHIRLSYLAHTYLETHIPSFLLIGVIYLLSFYFFDLHYVMKDFRTVAETLKIVGAHIIPFLIVGSLFYFREDAIGRGIFLLGNFILIPIMILSRWIFSWVNAHRFLIRKAIIFGCSKEGTAVYKKLVALRHSGIEVKGFVRQGPEKPEHTHFSGARLLGCEKDLSKLIEKEGVDLIILATDKPTTDKFNEFLIRLRQKGVYIVSMPALYEGITGELPYEFISSSWLLEACLRQKKFGTLKAKRLLDIVISLIGIVLTSPVMALAALLVKLDSKGPALFKQERLGADAKPYQLIKFRTMVVGAEKQTGAVMATTDDKRVTRLGKFFRKFRVDELPQLFNVLKGEMSVIGPRPERPEFIRHFEKKIPFYSLRLAVKPGITGWAQVNFRYASTFEDIQKKFRYDLYYLKNLSFWLDIQIVVLTFRVILLGFGGR